jgi:hypothetical protein
MVYSSLLLRKLIRARRADEGEGEEEENKSAEAEDSPQQDDDTVATTTLSTLEQSKETLKNVNNVINDVSQKMKSKFFIKFL